MQNVDAVNVSGAGTDLVDLDDGSLLAMTRSGSSEAYAALFSRYSYAAHRLARHLGQKEDSDDVVSEAFAQVLDLLGRGKGPETAFRAYLFTTVRHECARRAKARKRVMPTDDMQQIDSPVAFGNGDLDDFERSAIRSAYESLPPRWRTVLWHLDVEGRKPHELGPLLDLSPNSVSALVYRARAGLREAYLRQHVKDEQPGDSRTCTEYRAKLSGFVRHTATARDQERIHTHLESCRSCMAVYLDLQEVNRDVGAVSVRTVTFGALSLTLTTLATHAAMLVKGFFALVVPPAAAAAIATATLTGIPSGSARPTSVPTASSAVGSADVRAEKVGTSGQAPRPASAHADASSSSSSSVSRAARPFRAKPAAPTAPGTPTTARPAMSQPATAVPDVVRTAQPPAAAPKVDVRVQTPAVPTGAVAPQASVTLGGLDLMAGGADRLLSVRTEQ